MDIVAEVILDYAELCWQGGSNTFITGKENLFAV